MARKHKHEEHANHEAWAIPYGDLVTLLLAFFVVMYAVSSINEGKYRVMAESMTTAFGGPPRSFKPVQIGDQPERGMQPDALFNTVSMRGFEQERSTVLPNTPSARLGGDDIEPSRDSIERVQGRRAEVELMAMSKAVQQAMQELIEQERLIVRRTDRGLEIEINTDILFASGAANISQTAVVILERLARVLAPFPNALQIEGHTDDRPIATLAFPSNWELSAARAATVVHLFMRSGVEPTRMTVVGLGEYHPAASNATTEGRNRNRRVVIVALARTQLMRSGVTQVDAPFGPHVDGVVRVPTPAIVEQGAVPEAGATPATSGVADDD